MTERQGRDGSKEGVRERKEGRSGRKVLVYSITVSQFLRIHFPCISNIPPIQQQFALRSREGGRERELSVNTQILTSALSPSQPGSHEVGDIPQGTLFGLCYQDTTEASLRWKSWCLSAICSWPWTHKALFPEGGGFHSYLFLIWVSVPSNKTF